MLHWCCRNDGKGRRNSKIEKVVNYRQKEKDILDSIIGKLLLFTVWMTRVQV